MRAFRILYFLLGGHVWLRLFLLLGLASMALVTRADENARPVSEEWYAYDSNGNVILLTDAEAKPTAHYQYDAFGKTLAATGPAAESNAYRFSTKPIETASGLAFYGYRYYLPELGRWPSKDPIGERGGSNLYRMCCNGATSHVDIYGAQTFSVQLPGGNDEQFEVDLGISGGGVCSGRHDSKIVITLGVDVTWKTDSSIQGSQGTMTVGGAVVPVIMSPFLGETRYASATATFTVPSCATGPQSGQKDVTLEYGGQSVRFAAGGQVFGVKIAWTYECESTTGCPSCQEKTSFTSTIQ